MVRLGLAAGLLALSLAVPTPLDEGPLAILPAEPELGACLAAGCPDAVREAFVAQVEDHLFVRMSGATQRVHELVARALAAEAEAVQVDPLLVLAMIEVESGYDPAAASHAGARGLMQLLPATMQREMEALGHPGASPEDPVANVRAGIRYLRRCLDAYPGRLDLALMSYNSGPNRVLEFIQDGVVPDWASAYPRRVDAEWRRLRKDFGQEPAPQVAEAARPAARWTR